MEMIRRLSEGRLSEILGEDLIDADKYFRTLGIAEQAKKTKSEYFNQASSNWQLSAQSYLNGINHFIDQDRLPPEFKLLGFQPEEFEPEDIYTVLGYMGLGFSMAIREDHLWTKIYEKLGPEYLTPWISYNLPNTVTDSFPNDIGLIQDEVNQILDTLSIPVWYGSNAWVISKEKSQSNQVILANDTHIKFSQPSVWYEAHLNYPGFEFYGNYLAGVPFGIIGHNRNLGWGLTIFPFDNMDLFREKLNPNNENEVWVNNHWEKLTTIDEVIDVKDKDEPIIYKKKVSRHGPILNEVSPSINRNETNPISLWWSYLDYPTKSLEAVYNMNNSLDFESFKKNMELIDFLGLNVVYGDNDGNIAKWSTGKLPRRPQNVNSNFIIDSASGKNEYEGYYPFSQNPQIENPEIGFIGSANDSPDTLDNFFYYGYFLPENRISKIESYLSQGKKFTIEDSKALQNGTVNDIHKTNATAIINSLLKIYPKDQESLITILSAWDGNYNLESNAPIIYTKLIYEILQLTCKDELSEENLNEISNSYIFKKGIPKLLVDNSSPWWDNIKTENKETKSDIIHQAYQNTKTKLFEQLGEEIENWHWKDIHQLTHNHPFSKNETLAPYFNVGPYPVPGGNGTLNKMQYSLSNSGIYEVASGPALRIIIDFNDIEHSLNVNPTGQSGNILSPHYSDQAEMYAKGEYRYQLMNRKEIEKNASHFIIKPAKK